MLKTITITKTMYNTTYKVPSQEKPDWAMAGISLIATIAMCFAFAKAVDGPGQKTQVKPPVVKQMKGK
jgi:hypothetical protein